MSQHSEGQEWGFGSVVVESAFVGCPDFQSRGPETLSQWGNSGFIQQDTKEYLNQRVPKSEFSWRQKRGDKGGGEEGRSGGRVNRA